MSLFIEYIRSTRWCEIGGKMTSTVLRNASIPLSQRLFTGVGLRRMFYLTTPMESQYERVEQIPDFFEEVR